MSIYSFELKRAFKTPGFYLALLTGGLLAVADWINYGLQQALQQDAWMGAAYYMKYPFNVYTSWMGGSDSKYAAVFFLILPLLAVMPFAASFYQDNRAHYINFICTRTTQKSYFCAKFISVFVTGGVAAVAPLALNFGLCAAVLPCVLPQTASGVNLYQPRSTFSTLYFSRPLLFTLLSVGLIFLFAGTLAVSALYVAFYARKVYTVLLYPFILCLVVMSGADLLNAASWQPINFLNPAFNHPRLLPLLSEMVVLLAVAVWEFVHRGRKQDIVS